MSTPSIDCPELILNTRIKRKSKASIPSNTDNSAAIISTQDSSKSTINQILETSFRELFKKYNIEYSIETLVKLTGEPFDKDDYLPDENKLSEIKSILELCLKDKASYDSNNKINAELVAEKFQNIKSAKKSGCDIKDFDDKSKAQNINEIFISQLGENTEINKLSDEEKIQAIKSYFNKRLESGNAESIRNDLYLVLYQTSDSDKKLLLPTIIDFIRNKKFISSENSNEKINTDILNVFFDSFKNENIKIECANNADFDDIFRDDQDDAILNINTLGEIITDKNKLIRYANILNEKLDNLSKECNIQPSDILQKAEAGTLNDKEKEYYDELCKLTETKSIYHAGILSNKNLSEDQKKGITEQIINTEKERGTYDLYLKILAKEVSENKSISDEDKNVFAKILDEATNKDFSKTLAKLPEKSANDSETGFFKTRPIAEVVQAVEKKAALEITEIASQKENIVKVDETNSEQKTPVSIDTGVLTIDLQKLLKSTYTTNGNTSNLTPNQKSMLETLYQKMPSTDQIQLLCTVTNSVIFDIALKNTPFGVLKTFVEEDYKCATIDKTQAVESTYEEQKKQHGIS